MQLWRYGRAIEKLGKRYQLKSMLGSGGMADVCLAWDEQEQREVAVKVIKLDHLNLDVTPETLPDMLNRFLEEGSLIVHWRHPHILRMYDRVRMEVLDPTNGSMVPYIVMEYMPGGSLQNRLQPGRPLPLDIALSIFEQLCDAVHYAHAHDVIHRDIKPANVLFRQLPDGSEQVVLSDFGLAVSAQATHHTFPGAGSPAYMAPEQLRGQAQKASDIFALGVLLYRLCTGKLPFVSTFGPLPFKIPIAPGQHNSQLPAALDAVMLDVLVEDPDKRLASADLFLQQVRVAVHQQSYVQARPLSSNATSQTSIFHAIDQQIPPSTDMMQKADATANPLPIELPVRHARTTVHFDAEALDQAAVTSKKRKKSKWVAAHSMHRPRNWLIAPLLLLALLLVGGGVIAYFPGTRSMLARTLPIGLPATTVSITPANQVVADSYVIADVPNNPDAARLQITARPLTQNAQQQKTVTASGHNLAQGAAARGKLTFSNGSFSTFTVAAGTAVKKEGSDVVIVTDTSLVIPAAVPGGAIGNATVAAHATMAGAAGNLPAQAINGSCCSTGNFIFVVNNAPFAGGQDPKDYKFVQQNDVDVVVNPLRQPLMQQAWSGLQKQVASNEQLMSGAQCTSSLNIDQPVGDKGTNVPQAIVTVAVKCTGTAYNRQQVVDLAKERLQRKVDTNLGTGYVLVGNVQATIKSQTVKDGTLSLIVDAKGVWVYQFTDARKQVLAKQIAGKSMKDATALLQGQKNINNVQFTSGDVLPADPTQIAIQVQSITGLSGNSGISQITPTVIDEVPSN